MGAPNAYNSFYSFRKAHYDTSCNLRLCMSSTNYIIAIGKLLPAREVN